MFHVTFSFQDRSEEDLIHLNQMLGSLALSSLDIAEESGYTAQSCQYSADDELLSTTVRTGFDRIDLICEQEEGEETFCYQIDTAALPLEEALGIEEFADMWTSKHPDQVIRILLEKESQKYRSYILAYHKRKLD